MVYMMTMSTILMLVVFMLEKDSSSTKRIHAEIEPYLIFGVKICSNVYMNGLVLACYDDGAEMFFD